MTWTDRYLGVPYVEKGRTPEGWDCWGLVAWLFRAEKGIELPAYTEAYASRVEIREAIAAKGGTVGVWHRVEDARPFDVAMIRRGSMPHVGLVCGLGLMIHAEKDRGTSIEDYTSPRGGGQLTGLFRHAELL